MSENKPFPYTPSEDFPVPLPASKAPDELPDPIIWRADDTNLPVLRQGQVCLLTGRPGIGKSRLSLALAVAGCLQSDIAGKANGLFVSAAKAGSVMYLSFEETPAEVKTYLRAISRANRYEPDEALDRVHVFDELPRLWEPDREGRGLQGNHWLDFWKNCEVNNRKLVILDNAEAMLAAFETNTPGAVRDFINAVVKETRRLNIGLILICHPSKTGAEELKRGIVGPGAVSGSAAFLAAARSALALWRKDSEYHVLELFKCNSGPSGWGVLLRKLDTGPVWGGFEFVEYLSEEDIEKMRPSNNRQNNNDLVTLGPDEVA